MSEPDLLLALRPVLEVLERLRVRHYVGGSIASSAHGVARASVLAKLEWYRRGGEASERQWKDVRGVLDARRATLDLPYLRNGARELGVADLLERALVEAGLS